MRSGLVFALALIAAGCYASHDSAPSVPIVDGGPDTPPPPPPPPLPTCGNGAVDPGEECDGTVCDDGSPCSEDCRCPLFVAACAADSIRARERMPTRGRVSDLLIIDDILYATVMVDEMTSDLEIYIIGGRGGLERLSRTTIRGPASLVVEGYRIYTYTNHTIEVHDTRATFVVPAPLGSITFPETIWAIDVRDELMLGAGSRELLLLDATRTPPMLFNRSPVPGHNGAVAIAGARAVVTTNRGITEPERGVLSVVDIADPDIARVAGSIATPGDPRGIDVVGDRVYVADGLGGLTSVDIATPERPSLVDNLALGTANDVEVIAGCAYIAAAGGVALASVAPSGRMALLLPPGDDETYLAIAAKPPYVYVAGTELAVYAVE